MSTPVFILATVRNPALLDAALLVFKTLRVGFPTAAITVRGNQLETFANQEVARAARAAGCDYSNAVRLSHDAWIEQLLGFCQYPFFVCDTDVVFWDSVEGPASSHHDPEVFLAGRLEPEFAEEWTKSIHVERLHTCLLYLNPRRLRIETRLWMGRFPSLWHSAQMNLVRQQFIARRSGMPLFYDTCAGLWQALGGTPNTPEQDACFEHLHCGTYADLISGHTSLHDLQKLHQAVYADPQTARGIKQGQAAYYESRRVPRGPSHPPRHPPPATTLVVGETQTHLEKG